MLAKRIVLVVISVLIGVAGSTAVLLAFGTDPQHFAWSNTILLFLAFGFLTGVWLDYFLGTNFMKP
jgi:ABC-type transport system involved in multi-copper enzyme maturation permease subunit